MPRPAVIMRDVSRCVRVRCSARHLLQGKTTMLFSKQLSLADLIEFCRVLRHNLSAGLTLRHVFRHQATRGPLAVRPVAGRISEQIEKGDSLEQALKGEKDRFPPIFLALATVGEE